MTTTTDSRCGRCGRPEDAHRGGTADETDALLQRLHCRGFAVSRAAVADIKTETHATGRTPLCGRCGRQGHDTKDCAA